MSVRVSPWMLLELAVGLVVGCGPRVWAFLRSWPTYRPCLVNACHGPLHLVGMACIDVGQCRG